MKTRGGPLPGESPPRRKTEKEPSTWPLREPSWANRSWMRPTGSSAGSWSTSACGTGNTSWQLTASSPRPNCAPSAVRSMTTSPCRTGCGNALGVGRSTTGTSGRHGTSGTRECVCWPRGTRTVETLVEGVSDFPTGKQLLLKRESPALGVGSVNSPWRAPAPPTPGARAPSGPPAAGRALPAGRGGPPAAGPAP